MITDFKPNEDVIQFDHSLFANFAAVQSHASNRIVDVCGITGQQYASLAEGCRYTLVGDIEVAVNNLVGLRRRKEFLHSRLDGHVAH